MTDKIVFECVEARQAHRLIANEVWPYIKAQIIQGYPVVVEVKRRKRSLAENAMLHALISRISAQMEWAGSKRSVEVWKRLLTAAWLRARGEQVEILPALDGHGVDVVFRRTSELDRKECADLIEYVLWWAADHGIDTSYIDPETGEVIG